MQTTRTHIPQSRNYTCASLDEAAQVMNREWSAHDITASSRLSGARSGTATIHLRDLTADVSVGALSFGTGIRVKPRARADVLLMHMPVRGSAHAYSEHGESIAHPDSWTVMHAPAVHHVDYTDDHDMQVLRLPMAMLRSRLETMLDSPLRRPLVFQSTVTRGDQAWNSWAPLHAALGQLQLTVEHQHSEFVRASIAELASAALLTGWPHSYSTELLQPKPPLAPRHVRRAEDFMREHAHEPLTSARVAAHVGVSVRTLFDGFVAFRSMTPAQYFRQMRLDGARVDLLASSGSVAEIAARWGFFHSGRFARGYRQRFHESPANTLRASRGT